MTCTININGTDIVMYIHNPGIAMYIHNPGIAMYSPDIVMYNHRNVVYRISKPLLTTRSIQCV